MAEPIGVVFGVTPVTNPTATALPEIIEAACDDISLRSNPRMPLLHELDAILRRADDGQPACRRCQWC